MAASSILDGNPGSIPGSCIMGYEIKDSFWSDEYGRMIYPHYCTQALFYACTECGREA